MHASIHTLSLDTLVQILCKLDHGELKRLLLVSKTFHKAALVARQLHFDFSTPLPSTRTFTIDESPRIPLVNWKCRKPSHQKPKLSEEETRKIAVVLFPAGECKKGAMTEPGWAKNPVKGAMTEPGWAKNPVDLVVTVSDANI